MPATMLKSKIASGAIVVDVRSPGEFMGGSFPGALNIPLPDLSRRMAELPKEKSIIVYCASGARSAAARSALLQAGYADVINAGGLRNMPR